MAMTNKKKPRAENDDVEQIKNDVASFASSLGLSSALPSSGFNDSDFRKSGPMKPNVKAASRDSQRPINELPVVKKEHGKQHSHGDQKKPNFRNNQSWENKKQWNERAKPREIHVNNRAQDGADLSNTSFQRFKNLPKLPLVKAHGLGVWYVDEAELEEKVLGGERKKLEIGSVEEWKNFVEKKRELGARLLAQYSMDYEASKGQNADIKMLLTTQRSGTAADKVSAYTVLIGDNAPANLRSLDALLAMVSSKVGKRHALSGFEALKELFAQSLLPDRKLKTLFQQPLKLLPETKDGNSLLLFWYWEDCLKQRYERFIAALEEASMDVLPILKDKALKTIYFLLKSKSEQERRLLTALVNKLGAPENKGASNADFYLTHLLSEHPNMKGVVVSEVDSFLFRPRLGLRAKYHAVNFLSQIRLSRQGDGPKVAKQMVDVYFLLFKVLVSETGHTPGVDESDKKDFKKGSSKDNSKGGSSETHVGLDSRILSALLTGINRAFPFVLNDEVDEIVEVQTPILFQLVHSKNFNVSIQALMLLDKISSKNQVVSDRFYRALYSKLLLPAAMNTSKSEMFIGLLLRTMKSDVNLKRVAAFAKRILQVALQQPPQYACGCLFLLSEVLKARPPLWHMVVQNESIDDEIEHFDDAPDETDNQPTTVTKETRGDETTGEDARDSSLNEIGDEEDDDDDDEEEAASSAEENDDDDEADLIKENSIEYTEAKQLNHSTDLNGDPSKVSKAQSSSITYNPQHREPAYCNAHRATWWELIALSSHVHPSVSTMAKTILSGANIVYNGNPLNDLCLTAFLDKFMEKKPKQTAWHGGSEIEPAKKLEMDDHLFGPEILSLPEEDVPPEDLVFHKFYVNKVNSSKKLKKKKKKSEEDEDLEALYVGGDESDDEEIDEMLDAVEPSSMDMDGGYDYDDLDKINEADDDDLIGDEDGGSPVAIKKMDDNGGADDLNYNSDEFENGVVDEGLGDHGNDDDGELVTVNKRKNKKHKSASPFASLEEYAHLLVDDEEEDVQQDDDTSGNKKKRKNSSKSRKKQKLSK